MTDASIALNRFGLGARPEDAAPGNPKRWLIDQIASFDPRPPALSTVATSGAVAANLVDYYEKAQAARAEMGPRRAKPAAVSMVPPAAPITMPGTVAGPGMTAGSMADGAVPAMSGDGKPVARPARDENDPRVIARKAAQRIARDQYVGAVGARMNAAILSPTPFAERLVHFWSNHFAVSTEGLDMLGLAGTFEFEAIRPHVMGKFGDMLNAVERHPAMLLYLDQAKSVGPNSPLGSRVAARGKRKIGLNENLAREIMELHTLGVRTGYSQADVTEFARAMTGWTVAGIGRGRGARAAGADGAPGSFIFVPAIHEPGARTIIGKSYAEGGETQAQAALTDFAGSPATATHIATKLARHFAGDVPPPALVARLKAAYLKSGGDLPTLYRALIDSPETWAATPAKFKTPWEWSVSSMRALGTKQVQPQPIVGLMNQLGQPIWKPGQPVGYDDIAASWAGPDAVLRRVEAAERMAARAPETDARALAPKLFLASVSASTKTALDRAESPGQALALLLVSPEMMRR